MKRKYLFKIILFLLFISGGFYYLNKVFSTKDRYVNTAYSLKELSSQTNIDVLLLGSSHVYTAINPEVINNESKTISLNLGSDGLRFQFSSMVLLEALKYTKPKLVVVEIFRGSVTPIETDVSKGFQLRAMDFVSNFSPRKLDLTLAHFEPQEIIGVYSPLIRNHENWADVNYFDLDRRDQLETQYTTFYDGFLGTFNNLSIEERKKYLNFKTKKPRRDNSAEYFKREHIEEFERLVAMSKKHNFELLILTNPDLRATSINNHFYDQVVAYSEQFGLPHINYNEYYDALDLSTEDFKDASHLNYYGAHKTSLALSKYINENYNLPDRSNDVYWRTKSATYNDYLEVLNGGKVVYQKPHNDTLHDQIILKNLQIRQSTTSIQFNFDFDPTHAAQMNDRYKIGVQVYPTKDKLTQLGENSIETGKKFDNYSSVIYDVSKPLLLNLKTNISSIDKIRLFIFDKEGFKGTLGTPLTIDGQEIKKE